MDDHETILIVDDDEISVRLYQDFFLKVGFQVEIASDGPAAIEALSRRKPDVVLLDIFLPGMNGVEVLKNIRAKRSTYDLPVIMFSTSSTTRYVDAAWQAGATKCLAKDDFDPYQLLNVVRTVLTEKKNNPAVGHWPAGRLGAGRMGQETVTLESLERECQTEFLDQFDSTRAELRKWWQLTVNSERDRSLLPKLAELTRVVLATADGAKRARLPRIEQVSRAFHALLAEWQRKLHLVNPSTLRTASEAVDFLCVLFETPVRLLADPPPPGLLLIVDQKLESRELAATLKTASLNAVSARDPIVAQTLASHNRFHLIFVDADFPGMRQPDLAEQFKSSPANQDTPLVFMIRLDEPAPLTGTSATTAEAQATRSPNRSRSFAGLSRAGENDWIGKPIVASELSLKAVIHIARRQLHAAAQDGARANPGLW